MSEPWIRIIEDGEADEELQRLYDESRDPRGGIDNILAIHSLDPESLRAHLAVYRNAMRGSAEVSRAQREMIAVVVSSINGCRY